MICQKCDSIYGAVLKNMDDKNPKWRCRDCKHEQPWKEDDPVRVAGLRPARKQHCCEMMVRNIYGPDCKEHKTKWECPDCLIHFQDDQYGIIIHDGGACFIVIQYCPWCGKKL
jgi:rubrerythrin